MLCRCRKQVSFKSPCMQGDRGGRCSRKKLRVGMCRGRGGGSRRRFRVGPRLRARLRSGEAPLTQQVALQACLAPLSPLPPGSRDSLGLVGGSITLNEFYLKTIGFVFLKPHRTSLAGFRILGSRTAVLGWRPPSSHGPEREICPTARARMGTVRPSGRGVRSPGSCSWRRRVG
jgi:hypothetical protein